MFDLWSTFLGDQWSIGAWDAMREGAADHLPEHMRFFPVPRRAGAEPQGVRPRVGPSVLVGLGRRRRATTTGCCAA